ncbi:MAG: carbamoyltransferase HypF [Burkholderiales bacterium]
MIVDAPRLRRTIRLRGQVQGVGMRPFVWRLARELGVGGTVRNDGEGVEIEAEGGREALDALVGRLAAEAPPLARIDACETQDGPAIGATGFAITGSGGGRTATASAPDTAVCADCLAELFEPGDRRYRYAFVNCTHCGPRYTITRALPYDRRSTSMAAFALCADCRREYDSPADRRFHAQPNACPRCGPRLALLDAGGGRIETSDPVADAAARLAAGAIVAIKALGGFHLACDATSAAAVARLRERKHRDEKPFAVMLAGAASADRYAFVSPDARALLASPERPIVLLPKATACDQRLPGVAPGLAEVGLMLPGTPLHYLLFHELAGRPSGTGWIADDRPQALVMTSANPGGEPIVRDDAEAVARLAGIADAFVVHDRDIVVRCDDSVVRPGAEGPRFVRRARGDVPRAIRLPRAGPPVAALGGFLKNTVCVTRDDEAFVSQHVGDLDNAPTIAVMEETYARLVDLVRVQPAAIACDLHPDFASTRLAHELARRHRAPLIGVQHHHAHIAAIAAEHRLDAPVIGVALDGIGLGDDGGAWGGELLAVDGSTMHRLGHLAPLRLPGGDRAAREPWRMAVSVLDRIGRPDEIGRRFPGPAAAAVATMIERGVRSPWTTSAGRWFDAAAGLLRIRDVSAYEGQAAMLLEGFAARHGAVAPLADGFAVGADGVLDLVPLAAWIADHGDEPSRAAAVFHATLAEAIVHWVDAAVRATGVDRVALGGGCWLNAVLANAVRAGLRARGVAVLEARRVPPNDGGLSLGQAWVALAGRA